MEKIILCQWDKFSCFGCCGHDFSDEKEIREEIIKNTEDIERLKKNPDKDKELKELKFCGICKAIVMKKENDVVRVFCGLHPKQNNEIDLRDPGCEKSYFCKTMKLFITFDDAKKKRFLDFIKKKNPKWYEYSIKMDDNSYIEEFLKLES